jgi:hypothetical protein
MRPSPHPLAVLIALALPTAGCAASDQDWTGTVIAIGERGALTVAAPDGHIAVVRPAGVTVPARDALGGADACGLIYAAAWNRDVRVRPRGDADPAGQPTPARITLPDGSDLGEQLAWAGLATCADDAAAIDPRLTPDQTAARRENRGLWAFTPAPSDDNPPAPAPSPSASLAAAVTTVTATIYDQTTRAAATPGAPAPSAPASATSAPAATWAAAVADLEHEALIDRKAEASHAAAKRLLGQ